MTICIRFSVPLPQNYCAGLSKLNVTYLNEKTLSKHLNGPTSSLIFIGIEHGAH